MENQIIMKKKFDTQPIAELMDNAVIKIKKLLPKPEPVEYLSKIQNDQEHVGERLKGIREANGIELKDVYDRTSAEQMERGQFAGIDSIQLFKYAHEIRAKLGPFNLTPE